MANIKINVRGGEGTRSDNEAFVKFMEELMSKVMGQRPDFSNLRFSGSVNDVEGDGYAVRQDDDNEEDGWDDCSNCSGCSDPLSETESGGPVDDEGDCDDVRGDSTASITFSVRGPECFVDEVATDVHRLLKGLRSDALKYAQNVFEDDAEDAVSVLVSFSTSTAASS
jgi:hypothetical protein